jgi:predicted GNAT family acetyltransferase
MAAALSRRVAAGILGRGERAFLHVAEGNDSARRVYERLGFTHRRDVEFAVMATPS